MFLFCVSLVPSALWHCLTHSALVNVLWSSLKNGGKILALCEDLFRKYINQADQISCV